MTILRTLFLTAALVVVGCSSGDNARTTVSERYYRGELEPGPILVVDQLSGNIWGPLPSDPRPRVVVYSDGTVIYESWTEHRFEYLTVHLSESQLVALLDMVEVTALEPFDGSEFRLTGATDAGRLFLHARRVQGGFIRISAYGYGLDTPPHERPQDYPPPEVEKTLRALIAYSDPAAAPWTPLEFEVYVWECSQFLPTLPAWPAQWPELVVANGPDRVQTLRLEGTESARVLSVLGSPVDLHPKQLSHNGRVWCATYRPVFPYEDQWRRPAATFLSGPPN